MYIYIYIRLYIYTYIYSFVYRKTYLLFGVTRSVIFLHWGHSGRTGQQCGAIRHGLVLVTKTRDRHLGAKDAQGCSLPRKIHLHPCADGKGLVKARSKLLNIYIYIHIYIYMHIYIHIYVCL